MNEIRGDIWECWKEGSWIVVPTNGFVKRNGEAVMGAGLALQAKKRFLELPKRLGAYLMDHGNNIVFFNDRRLIMFPVKRFFSDLASIEIIERSARQLVEYINENEVFNDSDIKYPIYLPKVGCGNGGLRWEDVKPILEEFMDESKFVVCDMNT